jgi:hypothetical protein
VVNELVQEQGMQTDGASHDEEKTEKMIGGIARQHLVFVVVEEVVVEAKNKAMAQEIDGGRAVTLFEGPGKGREIDGLDLGLLPGMTCRVLTILGHEETLKDITLRQHILCLNGGRDTHEVERTRLVLVSWSNSTLTSDGGQTIVIAVEA